MALKAFGALALVTLDGVSGVHVSEESAMQVEQQVESTAGATLVDSQQYWAQIASIAQQPAAPAAAGQEVHIAQAEQCSQLHDPAFCDDKSGKCTVLVNNDPNAVFGAPAVAAPAAPVVAASPVQVAAAPVLAQVPVAPAALLQTDPAAAEAAAPAANLAFPWEPFKMVLFQNDMYVSRMAICHGKSWENNLVQEFMQGPLQGKTGWNFLDIGANLGSWTLPAAMNVKGHGGKVISVEADPQTIGTLGESVGVNSLLGTVELVQKAVVRDSKAKSSICLSQGDVSKVGNIGGNQAALGSRNSTFAACDKEVKTMTLDDLYATNPDMKNVAAIKLDCEGCEGQAILGAHKFFTEAPPCFLAMEITEGYLCDSDTPLAEIKTFLHDHGYDTSKIVGPHGGPTCADYLNYEKQNNLPAGSVQDFVTLGRRDASDATACMGRFQDKSFKL